LVVEDGKPKKPKAVLQPCDCIHGNGMTACHIHPEGVWVHELEAGQVRTRAPCRGQGEQGAESRVAFATHHAVLEASRARTMITEPSQLR
jgi:hypothetical protein